MTRLVMVLLLVSATLGIVPVAAGGATGCSSPEPEAETQLRGVVDSSTGQETTGDEPAAAERAEGNSSVGLPLATGAATTNTSAPTTATTNGSSTTATVGASTTGNVSSTTTSTSASTSTATSTTVAPTAERSGRRPDGPGNPAGVCNDGVMLPMSEDATCGYAEIGSHCVELINEYRAREGLRPFERLADAEACASREARLALEAGTAHMSDDCGWRSQASSGGGRGGEGSGGTIEGSVAWLPRLIYEEGPDGGHYGAMMQPESRKVSCGYFAADRDSHRIIINYYD